MTIFSKLKQDTQYLLGGTKFGLNLNNFIKMIFLNLGAWLRKNGRALFLTSPSYRSR
jgi:hypothetical protein